MKVTNDNGDVIEVYRDRIEEVIDDYKAENNIADLKKISLNEWNAILITIGKRVFADKYALKLSPAVNNAYDMDAVQRLCDYYTALCFKYDKAVSLKSFARFLNVDRALLYQWAGRNESKGAEMIQRLHEDREEMVGNALLSSNANPIGKIAILNHEYGWNQSFVPEKPQQKAISLDDIPRLTEGKADDTEDGEGSRVDDGFTTADDIPY